VNRGLQFGEASDRSQTSDTLYKQRERNGKNAERRPSFCVSLFLKQDSIVSGYLSLRLSSGLSPGDALLSREARFTWVEGGLRNAGLHFCDYTGSTGTRRGFMLKIKKRETEEKRCEGERRRGGGEGRRETRDPRPLGEIRPRESCPREARRVTARLQFVRRRASRFRARVIIPSNGGTCERDPQGAAHPRDRRVPRNSAIPRPRESDAASR